MGFLYKVFFLSESTFLEFIRIFSSEIQARKESKPQKCSKFIEIQTEKTQLIGKIILI